MDKIDSGIKIKFIVKRPHFISVSSENVKSDNGSVEISEQASVTQDEQGCVAHRDILVCYTGNPNGYPGMGAARSTTAGQDCGMS